RRRPRRRRRAERAAPRPRTISIVLARSRASRAARVLGPETLSAAVPPLSFAVQLRVERAARDSQGRRRRVSDRGGLRPRLPARRCPRRRASSRDQTPLLAQGAAARRRDARADRTLRRPRREPAARRDPRELAGPSYLGAAGAARRAESLDRRTPFDRRQAHRASRRRRAVPPRR